MIETAPSPLPIDCRGTFICARTGLQTPSDSNNTTMAVANTRNGRLIPFPFASPPYGSTRRVMIPVPRVPRMVARWFVPPPAKSCRPRVYPYLRFLYDTAKRDEPSDAPPLPLRPRPPAHPGRAAAPPPSGAGAHHEGGRPAGG